MTLISLKFQIFHDVLRSDLLTWPQDAIGSLDEVLCITFELKPSIPEASRSEAINVDHDFVSYIHKTEILKQLN